MILPRLVRGQDHAGMKLWNWQRENLPSIAHSIRTAIAATAAVIAARLVQMPEAYWAAIATLVVMQSSLGATLTLSIERVVATALGASVERSRQIISEQILPPSCSRSFSSAYFRLAFSWRRPLIDMPVSADNHCFDSALKSRVDRCLTSVH